MAIFCGNHINPSHSSTCQEFCSNWHWSFSIAFWSIFSENHIKRQALRSFYCDYGIHLEICWQPLRTLNVRTTDQSAKNFAAIGIGLFRFFWIVS